MKKIINGIQKDWQKFLKPEFEKEYFKDILKFLNAEYKAGKTIYPKEEDIMSAFKVCSLSDVKVVVIGQDPYHGANQAHGLSFSVLPGVKVPPSLRNMYKELETDIGCKIPNHGNLMSWAEQGVLLLNNVLTVEASLANSHKKIGWQKFTDRVVEIINSKCTGVVFILWGGFAQKKGKNIDDSKHFVITGHHPSPLSAYRGFFGCKHFSQTNELLVSMGKKPIHWELPQINKESSDEYTQLSF